MSKDQLVVHITTLDEQAEIIRQKLARKQTQPNPGSLAKNRNAERQLHRLEALVQYARELISHQSQAPSSGYSRTKPDN